MRPRRSDSNAIPEPQRHDSFVRLRSRSPTSAGRAPMPISCGMFEVHFSIEDDCRWRPGSCSCSDVSPAFAMAGRERQSRATEDRLVLGLLAAVVLLSPPTQCANPSPR